jgi:hypothetical protein
VSVRSKMVFGFLVWLGCLQMTADVLGLSKVKALAAATQMSPAMKVFTAHEGYETHAARFTLQWRDNSGVHELAITPEVYKRVKGPYNRRNVYGAALAYGPLLRTREETRRMQESVMRYGLCSGGPLREELGVPADAQDLSVRVTPVRPPVRTDLELEWEIDCHE